MQLEYALISFENLNFPARYSEKIRGYFGNKYKDITCMHNHLGGEFIYSYPLIQYKVVNNKPYICGIKSGAKILSKIGFQEDSIIINDKKFNTFQKNILKNKADFGIAVDYVYYEFLTPWIALNQNNINIYENSNNIEKEELLKKILIGNIISMAKGVGYTIEDNLHVWLNVIETEVTFKNINMKAFKGKFKVNFFIPNYLGLGKSVSRGFGSIKHFKK